MNKRLQFVVVTIMLVVVTGCNLNTHYDVVTKFQMMTEKLSLNDAEGVINIGLEAEYRVKSKAYHLEETPLLAVMLSRLSTAYLLEEELDRAFETAMLAESILSKDHGVIAIFAVLEPLRQSLLVKGKYNSALPYAEKLVILYDEYINRMDPISPYRKILNNHIDLATLYRNCGKIDDALKVISEWPMYLQLYLSELDDLDSNSRELVIVPILMELHLLMPAIQEYAYWETFVEIGELSWKEIDKIDDGLIEMKTWLTIQLMEAHTVLENYVEALYYCDYIHENDLLSPPHCDACAEENAHIYNCQSLLKKSY